MYYNKTKRIRLTIYTKAKGKVKPIILNILPMSLIEIFSTIGRRRYNKGT